MNMGAAAILVVDDDADMRSLLVEMLQPVVDHVAVAPDAYQALAALRAEHFDVVLLDLMLPGAGGIDLLERLPDVSPGVAVVVVTGLGQGRLVDAALEAGAPSVVEKPFTLAQIRRALGAAIADAEVASPAAG